MSTAQAQQDNPEPAKRLSLKQLQAETSEQLEAVAESTNEALGAVDDKIDVMAKDQAAFQKIVLEALQGTTEFPPRLEAAEQPLGETVDIESEGVIETPYQNNYDPERHKKKIDYLDFMKEPVCINIMGSSDSEMPLAFDAAVNGDKYILVQGEQTIVPRYIVEVLARAKPVHYSNEEYTDNKGIDRVRNPSRSRLRYPFTVMEDLNPRGAQWLKDVLAQP